MGVSETVLVREAISPETDRFEEYAYTPVV